MITYFADNDSVDMLRWAFQWQMLMFSKAAGSWYNTRSFICALDQPGLDERVNDSLKPCDLLNSSCYSLLMRFPPVPVTNHVTWHRRTTYLVCWLTYQSYQCCHGLGDVLQYCLQYGRHRSLWSNTDGGCRCFRLCIICHSEAAVVTLFTVQGESTHGVFYSHS